MTDARMGVAVLWGSAIFLGLYVVSLYDYLLFHSLSELFSVVVACGIFMLAWNSRQFMNNNYLLFLGIAYLFVGVLDTFHALAYKGMGVFATHGANAATQLWIAARSVESLSFLIAPFFIQRKINIRLVFAACILTTETLLAAIFIWKVFPACYVEGVGLTAFKVIAEYVICGILLLSIRPTLASARESFEPFVLHLVVASIVTTVASELAFTLYTDVYGLTNTIGHFLKIVSFFLVYKAIIQTGLKLPYAIIFKDLKQSEEALEEKAGELARSNMELEQFAYAASHDLQAPLAAVTGYLDLLKSYSNREPSPDEKQFIAGATEGIARMRRLINDLLAYARVGRAGRDFEPVHCEEAFEQARWDLQHAIAEASARVTRSPLPIVMADPTELRQVFQNLIGNAVKFHGQETPRVHVSAQQKGKMWVFSVSDNGIGIDPKHAADIFNAFQRLNAREYSGSGIGLATCKKIVERHGGRIWVESAPGQGATFYFAFPVRPGDGLKAPESETTDDSRAGVDTGQAAQIESAPASCEGRPGWLGKKGLASSRTK